MGYYVDCIGSTLDIKGDMFKKAIELLSDGMTAEIPDDIAEQGRMLCDALAERRLNAWLESDAESAPLVAVGGLDGEKWLLESEETYKLLAPVAVDGSYIVFCGEDADIWRYNYQNGKCEEQYLDLGCEAAWY